MRTLHGMHVHSFPNMFIVQLLQGAFLGSNVPHGFAESAKTIAAITAKTLAEKNDEVEVTQEAQDEWVEMLLRDGVPFGNPACTPGYYNNEGKPSGRAFDLNVGYPQGATAFFAMIDGYADYFKLKIERETLHAQALEWATTRGSRSGRVAWQYIQDLAGRLRQSISP